MDTKQIAIGLRKNQADIISTIYPSNKLRAKDAMIRPTLIRSDQSIEQVLKKLKKEHINACIVVTKEKKFIGEITDNDVIKLFLHQVKYEPLVNILNRGYRRKFLHKKITELINKHQQTIHKETPINQVIKIIWKKGFTYVPVLDKKEKVIGVVTPSSIINLLKEY